MNDTQCISIISHALQIIFIGAKSKQIVNIPNTRKKALKYTKNTKSFLPSEEVQNKDLHSQMNIVNIVSTACL